MQRRRAAHHRNTSVEASILKIAASLAAGEPVSLGPELTGLDIAGAWRVTTAVWDTTGHDAWALPGDL